MNAGAEAAGSIRGRGWARALSLAVAGLASLVLTLDPYVLTGISDMRVHAGLPLMMLGAAGLFMHGLGFEPETKAIRLVFHPAVAWLLFAAGTCVILGVP